MPFIQQAPHVSPFDPYAAAQPLHAPASAPSMDAAQPSIQQNGFSQDHVLPHTQQQSFQAQQTHQHHFIPPQGYISTPQPPQAQMQQPHMSMAQQPLLEVSNMTPQQIQQAQKIIQNMPPEKLQIIQQGAQQIMSPPQTMIPMEMLPPQPLLQQAQVLVNPLLEQQTQGKNFTSTPPAGLFGSKKSASQDSGPQDAQKSDSVKRFLGDTVFGRIARSSVQTVTSMTKIPTSLSPWGDNNPVTLPNVRYRDAALFTTFAFVGGPLVEGAANGVSSTFGADSFISEIVNSGAGAIAASTALKYSVFQIVEQAIDKGILEHMLPEEEKMLETTNVKSLQIGIKHKLMGVDADLRFVGVYPSTNMQACEKGWFCPYLFASARTPSIPRVNDFAIAQSFGPFLGGDYLLAHKLLSESAHNLSLCDPTPTTDIGTNRLLIIFTAISPYRANMWSTSRRPGCGTIVFHLLNGCPALIIPVTKNAPITAWSPWTLSQMRSPESGYRPEWQHEQICEYLDTIISVPHMVPALQKQYVDVLGRSVSLVINGALALEKCRPLLGDLDPERAGIVMLRY